MYDDALKKRFDFDGADLELNRNGSLSTRQVARLQKGARAGNLKLPTAKETVKVFYGEG